MRAPSAQSSSDLWATVALALFGLIAALAPVDTWVRVVALLPVVLVLPGYALAAALFPPDSLPAAERIVYVVALSISVAALGGVIVQLVLGLDRTTWAVLLFLVTLAASAAALVRRDPMLDERAQPRFVLPRANPLSAAAVLAAGAIAAGAIAIASEGARKERDDIRFTEVWVLPPAGVAAGEERTVSIGLSNQEGHRAAFQVRVTHGGALLAKWGVSIGDGRRWERTLPPATISPAEPLLVTVLKDGEAYRRVYLRSEPESP